MWLCLDSSSATLDLALVSESGACIEEARFAPPFRLSAILPEAILTLLGPTRAIGDLAGFVAGLGPGSFTGLRLGLATLKGLAYARRLPLVGASSLAACALEGPIGPTLYAVASVKRNELYLAKFRRVSPSAPPSELGETISLTVDACLSEFQKDADACILGPAVPVILERLRAAGVAAERILLDIAVPRAANLARLLPPLGGLTYEQEKVFALEPAYLRGSAAEENPQFPPIAGESPRARIKEAEEGEKP